MANNINCKNHKILLSLQNYSSWNKGQREKSTQNKQRSQTSLSLYTQIQFESEQKLKRNLEFYLSQIVKGFYKQENVTKEDLVNIKNIFDVFSKLISRSEEIRKISNLAEVAGFFNYMNQEFWDQIMAKVLKEDEFTMNDLSKLIRTGSYSNIKFTDQVWNHLVTHTQNQFQQLSESIEQNYVKIFEISKAFTGLNKVQRLNQPLIQSSEILFCKYYNSQQFYDKNKLQIVNAILNNGVMPNHLMALLIDDFHENSILQREIEIRDVALLVNILRQVNAMRRLNSKEMKVLQDSEEFFLKNRRGPQHNLISIAFYIYSYGLIDFGSQATWEIFEQIAIDNFEKLNKADFDMILAGFMSISYYTCSLKLQSFLETCIMQNYDDDLEEFILAVSYIGKQPGRGNKQLWDKCLENFIKYIKEANTSSNIFCQYFKNVTLFRSKDITQDQVKEIVKYIKYNEERFNKKDLVSILYSASQIDNFIMEDIHNIVRTVLRDIQDFKGSELYNLFLSQINSKSKIFTKDEFQQILYQIDIKFKEQMIQKIDHNNHLHFDFKLSQSLALNMALNSIDDCQLWQTIIKAYKQEFLQSSNINQQQYHLVSYISFLIKSSQENDVSLSDKLNKFIEEYKQFLLGIENIKMEKVKYENLMKQFEATKDKRQGKSDQKLQELFLDFQNSFVK